MCVVADLPKFGAQLASRADSFAVAVSIRQQPRYAVIANT